MSNLQLQHLCQRAIAPSLISLIGLADTVVAQNTPGGMCPAQLPAAIAPILNRPSVARVRWGILVQTQAANPANRMTLFARNPTTLLVPASNNKLFTATAVLIALGPHYTIRTSVVGSNTASTLTNLRVIGRGDPTLTTNQLTQLAQQLNQRGIRQVDQLVGDDSYFRGNAINPYWDKDDTLTGYGTAVNSLMLNQNAIGFSLIPQQIGQPLKLQWDDPGDATQWRVDNRSRTVATGQAEYVNAYRAANQRIRIDAQLRAGSEPEPTSVAIPNPGNYLIQKLRAVLAIAGIRVARSTLVNTPAPTPTEVELATVESPRLRSLLVEMLQESNNVYAEALLKTLGNVQSPNNSNSTESGIAAVKAALVSLGVNPTGYNMVDGSGLANRNRATATALVQVLQGIASRPEDAQALRGSLPVAGVSGTLKQRFTGTSVQGNLRAKTGYISGAVSLSGYLTPPNYSSIVVSILANYSSGSLTAVRKATDDVVLTLNRLQTCDR